MFAFEARMRPRRRGHVTSPSWAPSTLMHLLRQVPRKLLQLFQVREYARKGVDGHGQAQHDAHRNFQAPAEVVAEPAERIAEGDEEHAHQDDRAYPAHLKA